MGDGAHHTGSVSQTVVDGIAVANTGVVSGDIIVHAGGPVARSAYLEQVKQVAPAALLDREGELAELVRFCAEPDRSPYLWWRAPAWAGKSALLSWFVLNPPAGVRLVSFFITARFADQSDRTAFIDVVLEQLAELLSMAVPSVTEATREAHLLGYLAR